MQTHSLSVLDVSIVVVANGVPIVMDNFDPNSDILSAENRVTGGAEVSPDGHFNSWERREPIQCTLNVTAASVGGKTLQAFANAQGRGKHLDVSVIITNGGVTTTLSPGALTGATPIRALGNEKQNPLSFNFVFGDVL